jgi:ribonuclease HI
VSVAHGTIAGVIIVSTDGSCLRNPGGAIGWAWVDHDGGRFDSGGAASGTNQIAELTAVLNAVGAHPGDEPLLIESDSQYAIRCSSEWLDGWKRKGWRTASGGPVKNLGLVQAIDAAITGRGGPVRFRWVRGHVGNPFNERADELAGIAAQDWAAGRGEVGGTLLAAENLVPVGQSATASSLRTAPAARKPPAPRAAPNTHTGPSTHPGPSTNARPSANTGNDPRWELDTLFD